MRPTASLVSRHNGFSRLLTVAFAAIIFTAAGYAVNTVSIPASGSSAYVYVGSSTTVGSGNISGFAVAPDGSAQPVSGSPYSGASSSVVGAIRYLFATDGSNIVTYTVGSDGSLSQTSSVNGRAYDLDPQTSAVGGLSLTPNGRNLYTDELYFDGANNVYLAWGVNSSGQLSYLPPPSLPPYSTAGGFPFAYTSNSGFAYTSSSCSRDGSVWGFTLRPNGSLNRLNVGAQPPPPQQGQGGSDCAEVVATSALGYAAVAWDGGFCCGGPPVIATYAIQSNGSLTMIANSEQYVSCQGSPMAFDPSGRYLAVACNGIQIYSLNAQGLLTAIGSAQQPTVPFGSLAWDSANHLYGIPQAGWQQCQNNGSACGLYVFDSNAGVLTLASGSPHTLSQPGSLAVLPPQ
jgi:hypothetical protein